MMTQDLGRSDLDPVWTQFANLSGFGPSMDPFWTTELDRQSWHVACVAHARARFSVVEIFCLRITRRRSFPIPIYGDPRSARSLSEDLGGAGLWPLPGNRPHGIGWEGDTLWISDSKSACVLPSQHEDWRDYREDSAHRSRPDHSRPDRAGWLQWYCDDVGYVCNFKLSDKRLSDTTNRRLHGEGTLGTI